MFTVKDCITNNYKEYFNDFNHLEDVPEVQNFYAYSEYLDDFDHDELVIAYLVRDYFLNPDKLVIDVINSIENKLRLSDFSDLGILINDFKKKLNEGYVIDLKKLYDAMTTEDFEYIGF